MNANQSLAHWVATVSSDHTPLSFKRAKNSIIDTIGCMVIGQRQPVVQHSLNAVSSWGSGRSTVVGFTEQVPAPWAALVNGVAAHAMDLDDYNEFPSFGHPSAVLLPALLALGEAHQKSGADVLDAFIVGLEVLMRIGEAVNIQHYQLGWHASATVGVFGAAAGCARLLGLDADAVSAALSIASSCAAGYNSQFGTMTKPLHIGLAAHKGILATQLAATGMTASPDTLDGKWSFLTLLTTPKAQGFEVPLAKLGHGLAIDEYGLSLKQYPCCSATHRAIDGAIALRTEHRFSLTDITKITVCTLGSYADILPFVFPKDGSEAQFSLPYCVAVALVTGEVGFNDFTPAAIHRPGVQALIPLVTVQHHTSGLAANESLPPDQIILELKDGRILEKQVHDAKGMPNSPLSETELFDKFASCAQGRLSEQQCQTIKPLLQDFKNLESLEPLMDCLRGVVSS